MLGMAVYKTTSDNELLQLLKEDDHAAYTEIYHRYFYVLYVHAYKKLLDEEQAKDIIQEVFTSLWIKREFSIPQTNLAGYLFTAARNKIFDLFAHQKVEAKYIRSLDLFMQSHSNISADHRIREEELKAYIEKQIEALPPKMRLIFEMSRKQNLSHQEIAEKLNTNPNNISKQLTTALKLLKTKLGTLLFFVL
jgi:RNA polymerase sigma-70 factor (family 1)